MPDRAPQSGSLPSLVDNHGRRITYLRLAITDRCNLRCRYCMPEHGVRFVPHGEILRYEEMVTLVGIFVSLGITKLRITGGEPFARRDSLSLLARLIRIEGLSELYVTTNGIAAAPHLDDLKEIGISGINLSLDTLDPDHFRKLTGSRKLDAVLATLHGCLEKNIPLKINSVVLDETTDETIQSLAGLAKSSPLTVRFIEKMAFSGGNGLQGSSKGALRKRLARMFDLREIPDRGPSTARVFSIPGYQGRVGIIEGHSRQFCSTCNKLRITPLGILKTCLYDNGVADLKQMLRSRADRKVVADTILAAVQKRYRNGQEAEIDCSRENEPSMASIGG